MVEIRLLGPVELRTGTGEPVPVTGARLRTLLVLLALQANRTVTPGRLIDGVWADDPPAAAGNALQALVSRLRRTGLVVTAGPGGYCLSIDADRVDAARFARLVGDGDAAEALRLWRGELTFPEAAQADAVRLEQLRRTATREHLAARLSAGEDVVAEAERLAATHPADEPLAGLLMQAFVATGSPGRALDVFDRMRRRLAETLGTDPSPELTELHLGILREDRSRHGNLPAEVSSFVGRDADLRRVGDLLAEHRLVTLTGPGGSGKTRLSLETGRQFAMHAPDGVWRVELAPVTDPAEVPQAVLGALGLRSRMLVAHAGDSVSPLARLAAAVSSKAMLVILDNCEHLIGAAARVAETMVRASPGLRLLATSREPLGIPGERLWPVEPLALPPPDADTTTAMSYPAVRLLLDRAAGFGLDEATTAPAVHVCRALDGMPLAIELAAARLRTLPVEVLAGRLDDRFRLLTGGSRTALPRHQTLRAVVDWSWDLLDEPERRLWQCLAVLPGGADVTGAERMFGADPDLLGSLVDRSLLVLGPGGRYRMLETIREYGWARLAESGEPESTRRAVAAYLLDLAARAEPELRRADQLEWLRRLDAEHDNMLATIRAAIDAGDAATGCAMVARLGWYWWLRGHRAEGAQLGIEVLALPGAADRRDRALAHALCAMNGLEGALDMDVVHAHFRAAQELDTTIPDSHLLLRLVRPLNAMFAVDDEAECFRQVGGLIEDSDPWLRAAALMIDGVLRINFGHRADTAERSLRASSEAFRALGDRWGIAFTLSMLGDMAASRGDFTAAVRTQREAIAMVREVGIREDIPQLEAKLAHQLLLAGEEDEARRVLKQAEASAEAVGLPEVLACVVFSQITFDRMDGDLAAAREKLDKAARLMREPSFAPQAVALARSVRGMVEAASGELAAARCLHADALRLSRESKDRPVVAQCLVGVADLAMREGDPARAARLIGAADGVRGSVDLALPDTARITTQARAALGDAGYAQAYADGSTVTMAAMIEAAMIEAAGLSGPDAPAG
ncbi:SARP family transcriptional regulator [Mangrovihabitans endophyticus]|uniref:SARP family transcriptional regulator n=1 Tax=Mangrovihabitans endophyticus TaxID=1751298 RepID=A0A8J3BZA7_9ACTN|nr:SARP family transcriptional regulator [Mangrovihabitans endophyticus]